MRILYTVLFHILIPLVLVRILIKSIRNPAYLKRVGERFGRFEAPQKTGGIWVHSVSVGETIAAVPLIKRLQQTFPDLPITITTMSPTGSDRVKALLKDSVFHVYVPYDLPFAVNGFLSKVKPVCTIIMETEIWPNLLHCCEKREIPVLLANARLSVRSAAKYVKLPNFSKTMLNQFAVIAAQNSADAQRYLDLGAVPDKVMVIGSVKFDQPLPPNVHEKAQAFRAMWQERKVFIAASTHEGEDELILAAFAKVKQQISDALLFLVPRHPERFNKVANLCRKQGYDVQLRSSNAAESPESVDVFLGDTMGELQVFYAASDLAFVGGSLVPIGGHNMLEPAALGLATLTGPHVFNFTEISALLESAGGMQIVPDQDVLASRVIELLQDNSQREAIGANALAVVEQNRGTIDAYLEVVKNLVAA